MEGIVTCGFLGVFAFAIIAIAVFFTQRARLRKLQLTVETIALRVAALEAGGITTTAAPTTGPDGGATTPSRRHTSAAPRDRRTVSPAPPPLVASAPRKSLVPAIDWEAFMGVKLFGWVGGFVLFLGVVLLVKYAFQNNLITPVMQIVLGAVTGLALIAGGWFAAVRNYRAPGQSLCATGVLVLYAAIFAGHAYHQLLPLPVTFVLMSAITLMAFLLAVILDAQVVVVLGLLGGFLTPPLLNSGLDNPLFLFGYVALLNFGLAAVALRKKWDYLLLLAAVGAVLTELNWLPASGAADAGRVADGFFIFLTLQAQFLVFAIVRQRQTPVEKWSTPSALTTGFASLFFGLLLLSYPSLATRPGYFFGFNFLADIGLLALALRRPNPARIAAVAGAALFIIFSFWTSWFLNATSLWWALGAYLLFALVHAGFSVWPPRPVATIADRSWRTCVPLLALALLFLCVWNGETSFAVWACVLLIDLIALGLALTSRSVAALLIALLATIVTAGLWIVSAPPLPESVVGILVVVGSFGVFFSTASTFLTRKLGIGATDRRRNVPAIAAAMPFVLLLMLIGKLPVPDPTAVFAVAMLLGVVLLALGIVARTSWIALVALAFTWAVEREWHTLHFASTNALLPLGWYVAFFLIFAAYPYFAAGGTRSSDAPTNERSALPWAIGALSGFLHFWLVAELIITAYPAFRNGLLPAAFAVPYLIGLFYLIRKMGVTPASGDARLAWQGGAALLFLSLIFPVQFDREWVTLGWAVEGLALLILFRSVPEQRSAPGRRRAPGSRLHQAGAQPGRARIPRALRHADLELVSLRLRNFLPLPLRRGVCRAVGSRNAIGPRHPATALRARRRS